MDLILLGTGCPQVDPERYGPANLVLHNGMEILVDCGSGVTQQLVRAGSRGAALDAVVFTHLHSDHVIDFYQLAISSWHQGRDRPQRVFGPPGTRQHVEGTLALWRAEREQRIAHEQRGSTVGLRSRSWNSSRARCSQTVILSSAHPDAAPEIADVGPWPRRVNGSPTGACAGA